MQAFDPFSPPNLTELGTTLLVGNLTLSAFLMYFVLHGNVPENIPPESYGKALVGKIVIAILLAILSTSPATGPAAIFAGVVHLLASVGPAYFIYSMITDVFLAAILRRLEFYGAYKIIVFNLLHLPFITILALLNAYLEQSKVLKRAREDLAYKEGGVVLGEAIKCVRVVSQPVNTPSQARMNILECLVVKPVEDLSPATHKSLPKKKVFRVLTLKPLTVGQGVSCP
jgi:hypothetical protein